MCSIFGVLGGAPENVRSSSDKMIHRGPDGKGEYIDRCGRFCFFHNRLSFLDLSAAGSQPTVSRNSVLILNGEIYNFRELNQTHFPTKNFDSDTLLLQSLIEKYGIRKAISLLEGMYAIAYYDLLTNVGYLARDVHGEKPLYYSEIGNHIYFGSEIKSLLAFTSKDIDNTSLLSYIQFGFVNNLDGTIYQNIKRVLPGELITYSNHNIDRERVMVSVKKSSKSSSTESMIFEELFLKAVDRSCVSDVPLSCLFSGGLDSTAVLLAMKELGHKPDVFTLGFSDKRFDESARALMVGSMIGVNVNVVLFDHKNLNYKFENAYSKFDEPLADVSIIPLNELYAAVSESYKGVLTGDGGDEYQLGYSRHKMIDSVIFNLVRRLPMLSKQLLSNLEGNSKLLTLIYGNDATIMEYRFSKLMVMLQRDFSYASMFGSPYDTEVTKVKVDDVLEVLNRDITEYLPNNIFYKSDTLSMSHSVESRSPFVQQELTSWLSDNLPDKPKMYTKYFLQKHLGLQHFSSVKRGFVSPVKNWLEESLEGDYRRVLSHYSILTWASLGDENFRWRIYVLCKWLLRNGYEDYPIRSVVI